MPSGAIEAAFGRLTGAKAGDPCVDISDAACRAQPRSFITHAASLSATKTADGLIDPKLVLAWLLTNLGAGPGLIGLLVPVREAEAGVEMQPFDVVGPVCESGDTFTKQRPLPPLASGDLVAFRSAGAYGAVMSSEYNTRPLIPEVLVHEHQFAVIRSRPTFDEIINRDTIPQWLEGSA